MALVELKQVWKSYQLGKVKVDALRGVNLKVKSGTFMAVIGSSGSGKSTLLHIIGCLDSPTKGEVFLEGEDVSELSPEELAQVRGKKIGFVFQQFNLLGNISALDNVMLPMIFRGLSEQKRRKRALSLLKRVGLKERVSHRPTELSGGERQRVAIARSLANDPELVLADEPTGNLDSKTGKKVMETIAHLYQRENKTIVVVTHDPKIADYSKEIINIQDGKIVKDHKKAGQALWQRNG